jgi:cell division protein FtsW (lipid II flippase)
MGKVICKQFSDFIIIVIINHLRFIYLFIYLFIICKYTVAIFRYSRRESQVSLQMVVSHHVVAGI